LINRLEAGSISAIFKARNFSSVINL